MLLIVVRERAARKLLYASTRWNRNGLLGNRDDAFNTGHPSTLLCADRYAGWMAFTTLNYPQLSRPKSRTLQCYKTGLKIHIK